MPAINFKKEFEDKILDGTKRSTIRKYRKDGRMPAHVGDKLNLYTGMRTAHCKLIKKVHCINVNFIKIEKNGNMYTADICAIDNLQKDWEGLEKIKEIAEKEGFENKEQMVDWFKNVHKKEFETLGRFEGFFIQW